MPQGGQQGYYDHRRGRKGPQGDRGLCRPLPRPRRTLFRLLGAGAAGARAPAGEEARFLSPEEGFIALASLSLYCAFVLTLPAAGYLLWRHLILPRVPSWRRWGGPVIAVATALFACGVLLGYFVLLPAGIGFLLGFETRDVRALISAKKFISFCGTMLIALGLSFQAPLLAFFLAKLGWLKPEFFRNRWRHAILICTVLAAVITPTPDVYNMTLMAMPLLGLYFVSFLVVQVVTSGKDPGRPTSAGPPPRVAPPS